MPGEAVVINERLARELFGREDPVGRTITPDPPRMPEIPRQPAMRIVGVIRDFRKGGEFEPAANFAFFRNNLDETYTGPRVPRWLLVRARPGSGADFRGAADHAPAAGRARVVVPRRAARAGPVDGAAFVRALDRGLDARRRVPAHHGDAGTDRRPVAGRHAADARDRPAARQGRHRGRNPPPGARRGRDPDNLRRHRRRGGGRAVSPDRTARADRRARVCGRACPLGGLHLCADAPRAPGRRAAWPAAWCRRRLFGTSQTYLSRDPARRRRPVGHRVAGAAAEAARLRHRCGRHARRGARGGRAEPDLRARHPGHELLAPDDWRRGARTARAPEGGPARRCPSSC